MSDEMRTDKACSACNEYIFWHIGIFYLAKVNYWFCKSKVIEVNLTFGPMRIIESIMMNIDILMKAMRNQEPMSVIIGNVVKKMFNKSDDAYYPKFRLSKNRVYNEYLNRRIDYFEDLLSKNPDTTSNELKISVIIYGGNISSVFDTINSISEHVRRKVHFTLVDSPRNLMVQKEDELKMLHIHDYLLDDFESNFTIESDRFYLILDAGQLLDKYALEDLAKHLEEKPESDLITFDSDEIENKLRRNPQFRPSNNHLLLYNYNYIGNSFFIKGSLFSQVFDKLIVFDYIDTYGMLLEVFDIAQHPSRITEVLLSDSEVIEEDINNIQFDILKLHFEKDPKIDKIVPGIATNTFRVKHKVQHKPRVSIVIPFKNQEQLLRNCINSIFKTVLDIDYEIILADNGSTEKSLLKYIKQLTAKHPHISHFIIDIPFNFSRINNEAVKQTSGEYVLFLNNDIEAIHKDWLLDMMEYLEFEDVGMVGAKLLYGNNRVQHAGVILGVGHVAGHAFRYLKDESDGNLKKANCIQEIGAVTGACMLMKKDLFLKAQKFNEENLAIAYNDIDLCIKIRELGYKIIYTPYAKLYHHESQSRSHDMSKSEIERYQTEVNYMHQTWQEYLKDDPYHHPILSGLHESYEQYSSNY